MFNLNHVATHMQRGALSLLWSPALQVPVVVVALAVVRVVLRALAVRLHRLLLVPA